MRLGSLKGNELELLGIKLPRDLIKALEVFFSYDKKAALSKGLLGKN